MNIKQVTDMFDLTVENIRYYEHVGMIPSVKREKMVIAYLQSEN